jgi:hypothetical protein
LSLWFHIKKITQRPNLSFKISNINIIFIAMHFYLQKTSEEVTFDLKKLQFEVVSLPKFGKPYFKDSDGFPCQVNADTNNKMKKGVIDVALINRQAIKCK